MNNKVMKHISGYMAATGVSVLIFYIVMEISGGAELEIKNLPFISLILVCTGSYIYSSAREGPKFLIEFQKNSIEDLKLIPLLKDKFNEAGINYGIKEVNKDKKEMKRIAVAEARFTEALDILAECKETMQGKSG